MAGVNLPGAKAASDFLRSVSDIFSSFVRKIELHRLILRRSFSSWGNPAHRSGGPSIQIIYHSLPASEE
jgi:hypothetical protein